MTNPYDAVEPSALPWLRRHLLLSVLTATVVIGGLVALDWPHQANTGQQQADLAGYAVQLRGDVQSCSTGVEQTLSAYNQVTAGASSDRQTAIAIAAQAALDCTPMGNSRIEDIGAVQPPSSLAKYHLDKYANQFYAWCFPNAVDLIQELGKLLASPGDAALLAQTKTKLAQLNDLAANAQGGFDAAALDLRSGFVHFGLDAVRPGVLVG